MAEIIKTANPPVNVLFSVIQSLQLQPRWDDIPLPPGQYLVVDYLGLPSHARAWST